MRTVGTLARLGLLLWYQQLFLCNIFVTLYTQSSLYMYTYSLLRLQILSLTHAHIRGHIRYPFLTHALSLSHFLIFTRTALSDISCAKLGETV